MKKKRIVLIIIFIICLLFAWCIYDVFRIRECHEYEEYEKAIEIIQKIENYKTCHKKLPDSLDDIGEKERMEGPIYYERISDEKYLVWFACYMFDSDCVYSSDTKEWMDN